MASDTLRDAHRVESRAQLEHGVQGDPFDWSPSSTGLQGQGAGEALCSPHKVAHGASFFRNTEPGDLGISGELIAATSEPGISELASCPPSCEGIAGLKN